MEDYLRHIRSLRTQMHDAEEQAAMIYVEEQRQTTVVHTLEQDLNSATSETRQAKDDADQMLKTKAHLCCQILEKRKRIASLESDSSALSQTLDLVRQERASLSAKLLEKSAFYVKVAEDMRTKLLEQQGFLDAKMLQRKAGDISDMSTSDIKGGSDADNSSVYGWGAGKEHLAEDFEKEKAKLKEITRAKLDLSLENKKIAAFFFQGSSA